MSLPWWTNKRGPSGPAFDSLSRLHKSLRLLRMVNTARAEGRHGLAEMAVRDLQELDSECGRATDGRRP